MKQSIFICTAIFLMLLPQYVFSQHSIARQWNELLLEGIRNDFARPTSHARNLFHTSVAMYDLWAVLDDTSTTFLLGKNVAGFYCPLDSFPSPSNIDSARIEAISYASYRLLMHRFFDSPGASNVVPLFDALLEDSLGFDKSIISIDYSTGSPAALGNYMANCIIDFGLQDGSNEQNDYANTFYQPVNEPLLPAYPGNPDMDDPNRWQPLSLDIFIDQAGNPIPNSVPEFLSPEWGSVVPFALITNDLTIQYRDGFDWWTYHDPGFPPLIDVNTLGGLSDEYKWGFTMVALWASHLDPADTTLVDISPNSFGNFDISTYPQTIPEYRTCYDSLNGGDPGIGRSLNPHTGMPYDSQFVKRGDYARVLAEFWADGPDSETPPGHWFTILNKINDHPDLEKKYMGQGPILSDLEWDVKAYFALGGAMHDAAISAWGVKGFYDYLRPISAIRLLAEYGQCSDPGLDNYDEAGIHLLPGYIESVELGDTLAGPNNDNIGKIKIYSWRGPDYIDDPTTDTAGVGWILAENWWPYQRPTFVTPPFAGYVSGHSTFSRAAAEVLTIVTGDEYFPGGIGEFAIPKDSFLVFEKGPSEDLTLQWATYRDASDQTSLSRIWGGIHPPADDIPGRIMGFKIGQAASKLADDYFKGKRVLYVNPAASGDTTGLDWINAYRTLTDALDHARISHAVDEIRISAGTFFPVDTSRSESFHLVSGVTLKGGYAGNGPNPDERNIITFPTTLSGNIGLLDNGDNSYHVVYASNLVKSAVLDGLIIKDGHANGIDLFDQVGAGIYNEGQVTLQDILISDNTAWLDGPVVLIYGSEAILKMINVEVKD